MPSTDSLYVRYKKAEGKAFRELFPKQRYVGWKLSQWHGHLPLYVNPQTAAEVIRNIETSIKLRKEVAETLVRAVRLLPAGPTNTGHDQHRILKAQTIDTDEESLNDESLDEAGPTSIGHEKPRELQAQTIDTADESFGDESLDSLDRLMFLNAVQFFRLEASENLRKAGKGELRLATASIMSNMQATELDALLAQAELLNPSWFEPQDLVSWGMKDPALNFEQLIIPVMRSGLGPSDLPVAIQHLADSHDPRKESDKESLRLLIWKVHVNASIKAVDSSDEDHFREIVQHKVQETLRLAEQHQALIETLLDVRQTASMFHEWAQSASDILSIGQIAQVAEAQSAIVYRMILELPSITMFAYLCEYTRIKEEQSLAPLLETWFTDALLSKHLCKFNGRDSYE
ncbi:hypothetical protein CH63R_14488 [Colletotrichum higginsianum IMI 349063]|uniref:Uncharacterized protein n=1 Tax=Colletotrichum higginsianum (strain IMI 349063) TaxID=759273 RepID=A0A1B7XR06_COLHI|nr:hypothetical protein CH63R_14488 [Colletotrichum higginsianum IMI 349063]OBR02187.1 hypothetical protein CH63R_14488 [Colletotrichum higginsianum IMI 349063]